MRACNDQRRRYQGRTVTKTYSPVAGALFFALLVSGSFRAEPPVQVRVDPPSLQIGFLYKGAAIRVEGLIPTGSQPVVVIRGTTAEEVFHTKSRVGPLWISSGKAHIGGAPWAFLLFAPGEVERLVQDGELERYGLSFNALQHSMEVRQEGRPLPNAVVREHFIRLKANQGLYRVHNAPFEFVERTPELRQVGLKVDWPRTLPAGRYVVQLFACKDGHVVGQAATEVQLAQVGFVAWLGKLSRERPSFYGVLAIVLALAGGLTIDFLATRIFGRGRARAGH